VSGGVAPYLASGSAQGVAVGSEMGTPVGSVFFCFFNSLTETVKATINRDL
jgi:hypothetical protein